MKKMLGMCLTGCLLLGSMGAVSAETGQAKTKPVMYVPQDSVNGLHYLLVVNGKSLQDHSVYTSQNELMLPLRSVAEALGYEVKWNSQTQGIELSQNPHWFTLKIGEDRYNFARMLMQLGKAPELKDGKTYVPLRFVEQALKMNVTVDETGVITIVKSKGEAAESQQTDGVITEVTERENGGKQLHIMGEAAAENGQNWIALNIDEKTEIIDSRTSKPLQLADIKANMKVQAFYDAQLMKSLPPQGYAKRLLVSHTLGKVSGTIKKMDENENGVRWRVDGSSDQKIENDAILTIAPETIIVSPTGQKVAKKVLKDGRKITAYYGPIMTMSLPPMSKADTVIVEVE